MNSISFIFAILPALMISIGAFQLNNPQRHKFFNMQHLHQNFLTTQFIPLQNHHNTFQFAPPPPGGFVPNPFGAINPQPTGSNNNGGGNSLFTGDTTDSLANSLSLVIDRIGNLSRDPNFALNNNNNNNNNNFGLPNPTNLLSGAAPPPGTAPPLGALPPSPGNLNPSSTNSNSNNSNNSSADLNAINNQLRDILARLDSSPSATSLISSSPIASASTSQPITTAPLASTSTTPLSNVVSLPNSQPIPNIDLSPSPRSPASLLTPTTAPININNNSNNNSIVNAIDLNANLNPVVNSGVPNDFSSSIVNLSTSISRNLNSGSNPNNIGTVLVNTASHSTATRVTSEQPNINNIGLHLLNGAGSAFGVA